MVKKMILVHGLLVVSMIAANDDVVVDLVPTATAQPVVAQPPVVAQSIEAVALEAVEAVAEEVVVAEIDEHLKDAVCSKCLKKDKVRGCCEGGCSCNEKEKKDKENNKD